MAVRAMVLGGKVEAVEPVDIEVHLLQKHLVVGRQPNLCNLLPLLPIL